MNEVNEQDSELQVKAFIKAAKGTGSTLVLAQRKRRTATAVQFWPQHAEALRAGGLQVEEHPEGGDWSCFGLPLNPGDYIAAVSGSGIHIFTKEEFSHEWEVVGDA